MARVDQAVFLAAGRGVRLGPRGREIPKGFLEVGGTSLIERAVGLLNAAGIRDVTIVTGHLHAHYDALARRLPGVRTVHNPDFAESGSARSLAVGLAATEGPLLLLEADAIWEKAALTAVLRKTYPSLLLASGPTGGGDEVWIWAQSGTPRPVLDFMSKRCATRRGPPFGELVGITRIGAAFRAALLATEDRFFTSDPKGDYEDWLIAAATRVPLPLRRIDDLVWAEIDDEAMYARARATVWPRLAARE
ncbi:phosphocholine cytidylyltransferase family protein [Aquabacter spiritensis]|uniref:Choline kinase n=1 Tax=Aquabacter spiritensis TaxID=933073 RepID=A0A4R3LTZ3_9HYPH|nr:phosphocholine cytidylyltransferase family protein [Aquabacter spiritensis]TCT04022.1 choline kinase [Aquabacter spiritensis]